MFLLKSPQAQRSSSSSYPSINCWWMSELSSWIALGVFPFPLLRFLPLRPLPWGDAESSSSYPSINCLSLPGVSHPVGLPLESSLSLHSGANLSHLFPGVMWSSFQALRRCWSSISMLGFCWIQKSRAYLKLLLSLSLSPVCTVIVT